jgi:hypothetical protein
MFRKKQTPTTPIRRNVQRSPGANVFSYYAARSPSEVPSRRPEPSERRAVRLEWLKYTPSILATVALAVCLLYVSTLDATPKIQAVSSQNAQTIARNTAAYEDEAADILGRSIFNRSKLLIRTDKVARELQEAFPELGNVSVILPLVSRRPIIEVQPARAALILTVSSGAFVVDEEGRAVIKANEVPSSVRDPLPVVQDDSDLPVERGKGVLSKEVVAFIREVSGQLAQKQVAVAALILPATPNELDVRLQGRPYFVKFDLRGEGRQQTGTFLAVKARLEAEGVTPASYIDVRVTEKAFYK